MVLLFILFTAYNSNNTGIGHFLSLATFSYTWTISSLQLINLARLIRKLFLKYTDLLVCSKGHLKMGLMH